MKTNSTKWTNISDITKRSIVAGKFVKTSKMVTEFYQDNNRDYVNITNWNNEHSQHVYYKLDCSQVTGWLFVELRTVQTDELLQSNTFTTIKELKEYLKTL